MNAAHEGPLPGGTPPSSRPRILLVDDNEAVRISLGKILDNNGFAVVVAGDVKQALHLIDTQSFDVLLSDLHMPHAGDGLTVVSAMRHSNPRAVTLIFSGYPKMSEATAAILMQADEILVKPLAVETLMEIIKGRLSRVMPEGRKIDSVATILEDQTEATIQDWLERVDSEPRIITVHLDHDARSGHLRQLLADVVERLRCPLALGTRAHVSQAAVEHGRLRRHQGYSPAMLVEESRMLQVSIFQTLQNNLNRVDFSLLLVGVMAIADEVDSQLAQAMASLIAEPEIGDLAVAV